MPASTPLPDNTPVTQDLDVILADIDSLLGNLSKVYGKPMNVPVTMSAAVREDLARLVQVVKVLGAGVETVRFTLGHRQNFDVLFRSLLPIASSNPFNSQPGDTDDPFDGGTAPIPVAQVPLQISTTEAPPHADSTDSPDTSHPIS